MELLALILSIIFSSMLLVSSLALFRSKDVFVMLHVIKITNFYLIPLFLIAFEMVNFSWVSLLKIFLIILMNVVFTLIICDAVIKKANSNNISPDTF